MSAAVSVFITALLAVFGRLFTQPFFEAVITSVVIWCLEKLAPMTSNALDDELVAKIKTRLYSPGAGGV